MKRWTSCFPNRSCTLGFLALILLALLCIGCDGNHVLTADMPLHLEEHLDVARIIGSEARRDIPEPVEWRFDETQPDWRPAEPWREGMEAVDPIQLDDALRLPFTSGMSNPNGYRAGAIYVDLPGWDLEDWGYIEIRARTQGLFGNMGLRFNYTEEDRGQGSFNFYTAGDGARLVSDGTVRTYRLSLNWEEVRARFSDVREMWEGPWTHLAVWATAPDNQEEATLDILSIRVVPVEAVYAGLPTERIPPVEWRFDESQPDWRPAEPRREGMETVEAVQLDDALRLPFTSVMSNPAGFRAGAIYVDVPDWDLDDWGYVEIRARVEGLFANIGISFNYTEEDPSPAQSFYFYTGGNSSPLVSDGTVQTYRLSLAWSDMLASPVTVRDRWEGPWTHLAVWATAPDDQGEAALDILSIRVVPVEAMYAGDPGERLQPMEWHFDEPQPAWLPVKPIPDQWDAVRPVRVADALRLPLGPGHRITDAPRLLGGIYVQLPDWDLQDWAYVEIRARTRDPMQNIGLEFNYTEEDAYLDRFPFESVGDSHPLVTDGTIQTYRLTLTAPMKPPWEGPWTHLAIWFNSQNDVQEAALDILSVRVVPKEAEYASAAAVGVQEIPVGNRIRRAVYTHTPSRLEYRLRVPEGGRLDVGLGVLREAAPVTFRVQVQPRGGEPATLLEERYGDRSAWGQRSVDLAEYAGQTVTLALDTDAERAGTIAFWGAPTVTGTTRLTERPNVIFYVIDGGGAEYMSLYGYNRRTTPNLDRLAAEGAVFERAYSNASWTRPSTASFMTSLQHSVLGGFRGGFNVVPEDVPTTAQHLHRAGYQTGAFTPNPNAGKMSGLDREVDVFQEAWDDFTYGQSGHWSEGSRYLHDAFWTWREAYPGEPYWVHFQPVDTHGDFPAPAPFGGLFVASQQAQTWLEWRERRNRWRQENRGSGGMYSDVWEETGIDRVEFFTVGQGLYDETMAHNDYQLGRLLERIKAEGEWENTILIIAADHSIDAAFTDMAAAVQDSLPPIWSRTMIRPSITRIPLVFVWPGHIEGGQRFREPVVSMVDVLPTILDLAGLPLPEVAQGQSLAPLLLGEGEVEQRPVILDEFDVDPRTGELRGTIEVIDGRWGASLEINPAPPGENEREAVAMRRRPVPLLLFDLWNDPYCLSSIHEERPDLVAKYTAFLEEQWEAHQALGRLFSPSEAVPLTPEQLEALRALGYIR